MWHLIYIIPTSIIFYQDIKYKAISWWTVLLLFIILGTESFITKEMDVFIQNISVNLIVFLLELLLLFVYFSIKKKTVVNIFDTYLGIGDVLFFVAIMPYFHPLSFLWFQIIGLLLTLIISLVYGFIKKKWDFKIPLAGILSLLFVVLRSIIQIYPNYSCLKF